MIMIIFLILQKKKNLLTEFTVKYFFEVVTSAIHQNDRMPQQLIFRSSDENNLYDLKWFCYAKHFPR